MKCLQITAARTLLLVSIVAPNRVVDADGSTRSPVEDSRLNKNEIERPAELRRDVLVRLLFGDQWPLGRYCSSHLTASEKVANDEKFESLYNGTYLGAIEGSQAWPHLVLSHLRSSVGLALKSRKELAILCPTSAWGYADAREEQQANAPHHEPAECARQIERLHEFVGALTNHTNARPENQPKFQLHYYSQFHSFGRLPAGLPHKQSLLVGDYDQCARLASTRYCLGSYGLSEQRSMNDHPTLYQVGMCLPRACSDSSLRDSPRHTQMLGSIVQMNLAEAAIPSGHEAAQLQDVFCPPATDSRYTRLTKDRLSLALLWLPLPWMALLAYATLGPRSQKGSVLSSFDLAQNWRAFRDSRHLDPRLAGLSGVKTLAMVWLMLTHVSMTIFPYVANLNELGQHYGRSLQGPLILQGQHIVPSFFIISGLIVGLKYLSRRRPLRASDLRQMIVWRYFRLAPMYLLAWVYIRQFAHLLGSGPLWDSGVSAQSEVRQCRLESWWVPLLMLANFTPPYAHCLITGWHIANDFQIYLALPPLLLAFRRSRLAGSLLALAVFALSHLSHAYLWGAAQNIDLLRLMRDPARFGPRVILERMALDYVNPLGRVGTYFMGVYLADQLLPRRMGRGPKSVALEVVSSPDTCARLRRNSASYAKIVPQEEEQFMYNSQRRRSSTICLATNQINVGVPATASSHEQSRPCALVSGKSTDENNNGERAREESFQRDDGSGKQCEMTAARDESALTAVVNGHHSGCSRHRAGLDGFKDICLVALGALTFALVMFSVALPVDKELSFGAYTQALAYPACRIAIELSWSILLYYLLATNIEREHNDDGNALHSSSSSPKAVGGDEKLLTMMVSGTPPAGPAAAVAANQEKFTIARLLKLSCWNVLAKLNYALMLTHYALMRFVIQTQRDLFHFSWVNFAQLATFLVLASYLLALLVHLTIEMPLSALVRRLVARVMPAVRESEPAEHARKMNH